MTKFDRSFFQSRDVCTLAKRLLGANLITKNANGEKTVGRIVETEAYFGFADKGSHAVQKQRSDTTAPLYLSGGVAYIYRCREKHTLFKVVTGPAEHPHAVLIRALMPLAGQSIMLRRHRRQKVSRSLTVGPGALTQAMGITTELNGCDLIGDTCYLTMGIDVAENDIIASARVGLCDAGEDTGRPWRYRIGKSECTSRVR